MSSPIDCVSFYHSRESSEPGAPCSAAISLRRADEINACGMHVALGYFPIFALVACTLYSGGSAKNETLASVCAPLQYLLPSRQLLSR
jgi:hypothetical protein